MTTRSAGCFLYLGTLLFVLGQSLPAVAQSHGGGRGSRAGAHASGGHASGGGRGGGGWQRGGSGWWGVGLGLGLGWSAPYYDSPYGWGPGYYAPYDPQVVVVQAPQYQEQPAVPAQGSVAPPSAQNSASWYYCGSSQSYYPYVNQCAEGWRTVPAAPPGAGH